MTYIITLVIYGTLALMPIGPIILFPWYKAFEYSAMPYNIMGKGWTQGYTAHQFVQTNPPVHTIIIKLEVNYSKNCKYY